MPQTFLYNGFLTQQRERMLALADLNYWGFIAMPVGVVICFGPALLVWLKAEYRSDSANRNRGEEI